MKPIPKNEGTVMMAPPAKRLRERRFLTMTGKATPFKVETVWIDDAGSCPGQHPRSDDDSVWWNFWHVYTDPTRKRWAIRCPATLTADEQNRARADNPPGSAVDLIRSMEEGLREWGRSKRKRDASRREDAWND